MQPFASGTQTVYVDDPSKTEEIKEKVREYWDLRAEGYKKATQVTLQEGQGEVMRIIGRFINLNRQLKVADMGTGAGLFAILLAQHGHDVTAVDNSSHMLEAARQNAEEAGVKVRFVEGDVEEPPLEKGTFDLVVSRSTVWSLPNPRKAYVAWRDLLRPDGEMAIIDGNYYLDLYDEDYRRRMRHLESMKRGMNDGLHAKTNVGNVDFGIIRDIARDLPMSRERRPAWDVAALMGVGMTNIHVKSLDKEQYSVLTENGITELPSMFVVCAKMPLDASPYMDAVNYPLIDNSSLVRFAESGDSEDGALTVFKALSDIRRVKTVKALLSGRMSVQQISYVTGCSQSLTSHNLTILRKAGLVGTEKSGREVLYHLTDRYRIQIVLEMCDLMSERIRAPEEGRGS
jgi:SAM-dependent methyltransferase/DNA-binding transcriptional ArsR family regulator